ncbi:MAG: aldo/keto reductase [Kiritimatiellales bacterium]
MNYSKLMLGTVQFGMNYGIANIHGKPSFDTVKQILRIAVDSGITAFDTAAAYGDSEDVLGRACAELGISNKILIVSKIPPLPADIDPEKFIKTSLVTSLKRLRLEILPAALLHRETDIHALPILQSMIAQGFIQNAGISLDSVIYRDQALNIPLVQIPCNPVDHRFDAWIEQRIHHTFIRSVYLQGMLLMPEDKIIPGLAPYRRKLEVFGIPLKELCMRYLLGFGERISILTGVETPEQLTENIRLASLGPLPPEIMQAVKTAVPLLDETLIRPKLW